MKPILARILELEQRLAVETGPRGGKIIGHTSTGKPIYETHDHPSHQSFNKKEHIEAAKHHNTLATNAYLKGDHPTSTHHGKQRDEHNYDAFSPGGRQKTKQEIQKMEKGWAEKRKTEGLIKPSHPDFYKQK